MPTNSVDCERVFVPFSFRRRKFPPSRLCPSEPIAQRKKGNNLDCFYGQVVETILIEVSFM